MSVFIKDIPIERIVKDKLIGCVQAYVKLFPEENKQMIDQVNKKRWFLDDMEYGASPTDSVIVRALFEIPETLNAIIIKGLSESEMQQFRGLKGSRWFAKEFPQFRTPREI